MNFDFIEDESIRIQAQEKYKESVSKLTADIDAKIEEATSGLKSKNEELLDEKKKIQQTLKNFENIDPEKAREALQFLDNNEDAQLIKDGKIEEVIDKRTSQLRNDHEAAVAELKNALNEASQEGTTFKTLYQTKMIEDSLRDAAIKAKVRPEAITDILIRGREVFLLAEDGSVEARDSEGKLRKTKDEKVLTPSNWVDGLKEIAPHYWPNSEGVGASGGHVGDADDFQAKLSRAASTGNMKEYRRLRSIQKNKGASA